MSVTTVPCCQLGRDGPSVPALGFGLMGLSGGYGNPPSDEERFKVLDRAVELASTFLDTSNLYGDNEVLLGKWFKKTGKRDEIFLASKFGIKRSAVSPDSFTVDSSSEYCKEYYVHRANPDIPIEETMRAMVELKAEGKIKYIGLSGVSSTTLRRACKIATVAAVQMEYFPFTLEVEKEKGTYLLDTCRELNVALVCYSPLGRGLLTGTFLTKESVNGEGDYRGTYFPRFNDDENLEANAKLVYQFKAFADKKGCTPSQLALAWLRAQEGTVIPIPGTKKVRYLEENWASLNVHLTREEEAEIRAFVEGIEVRGSSEPPSGEAYGYVNTAEET